MKNNSGWYERVDRREFDKDSNHQWYTPPEIFDAMNTTFDLDVATIKYGLYWIPAKHHYYKELDGLKQKWFGFVWCNPPYGNQTEQWLEKFVKHNNGIALVFARTDTNWFHEYAIKCDIIVFTKGRIKFIDGKNKEVPSTKVNNGSTGSMFLGCGKKAVEVLENANLGYMIKND